MPFVVKLGLPILDRALLGFRKPERRSAAPTPTPGPPSTVELSLTTTNTNEPAPELPPLHSLNFSSFADLLNHVEVTPSPSKSRKKQSTHFATTTNIPTTSSSSPETLTKHNVKSMDDLRPSESTPSNPRLTNMVSSSTSAIPERQQSTGSSASLSKRSDASSFESKSSRSSVEETRTKPLVFSPLEPIKIDPLNMDFLSAGFGDTKLDLDLNEEFLNSPSSLRAGTPSTFAADTNKPLPLAPSSVSSTDKDDGGVIIPELDATSNHWRLIGLDNVRNDKAADAASVRTAPTVSTSDHSQDVSARTLPTASTSDHSQDVPADDIGQIVPPRKFPVKAKPNHQPSKKSLKGRSLSSMADQIIYQIFLRLSSLADLKAAILTNKRFHRVFKRQECEIVESVLKNASPAAWELRHLVWREQKRNPFQLKAVQRDLAAIRALQAFILMRCGKLCRPSTVEGLMGDDAERRVDLDNALWRIWTFCKLFGKGTSRDTGIHTQIMWLEGTLVSEQGDKHIPRPEKRASPPSKTELEDMSEMWRCMELLLSNFRGREAEAREAGIFDQCKIDGEEGRTESQYLEDWIYDILSVGPKAVLTMISCSFEHAKVLGVNKWTPPRPGRSRRTFLKAGLEQVYRDRLVDEASLEAKGFTRSVQQQPSRSMSVSTGSYSHAAGPSTSLNLTRSMSVTPKSTPKLDSTEFKTEGQSQLGLENKLEASRLEIRPDCDPEAVLPDQSQIPLISPVTNPSSFTSLAMMSKASARLGATLFPLQHKGLVSNSGSPEELSDAEDIDAVDLVLEPKVVDPSDRALSLLVKHLGFSEKVAKQALAMSDDGSGIDVHRAVDLLSGDRRLQIKQKESPVSELPGTTPDLSLQQQPLPPSLSTDRKENVPRGTSVSRKKSTLRGLVSRGVGKPNSRLSVIVDQEDEDNAAPQPTKSKRASYIPRSAPANQSEFKGGHPNLAEFFKYRGSVRSSSAVNRLNNSISGHRKNSSTGTVSSTDEDGSRSSSPITSGSPVKSHGGFTAINQQPQLMYGKEGDQSAPGSGRPKVTLTRVGTGRKPSKRLSLTGGKSMRPGEPPEIIGYTY